jgi:ATP-dependent DNA ligase
MECLPVEKIPEGNLWTYELKLDGYHLIAVKRAGKIILLLIIAPLSKRREILSSTIKTNDHIGISQVSYQSAKDMLAFVKAQMAWKGSLPSSIYEQGRRSGLWVERRINLGKEFVIGGYVPSHLGLDSVVIGFDQNGSSRADH